MTLNPSLQGKVVCGQSFVMLLKPLSQCKLFCGKFPLDGVKPPLHGKVVCGQCVPVTLNPSLQSTVVCGQSFVGGVKPLSTMYPFLQVNLPLGMLKPCCKARLSAVYLWSPEGFTALVTMQVSCCQSLLVGLSPPTLLTLPHGPWILIPKNYCCRERHKTTQLLSDV